MRRSPMHFSLQSIKQQSLEVGLCVGGCVAVQLALLLR